MNKGQWSGVLIFALICGFAGFLVGTMVGPGASTPNTVPPEPEPEGMQVLMFELVERLSAVEDGIKLKDEQIKTIVQQIQAISDAHNRMGNAFAQAGKAQQNNIVLMDRAIQRLHGKADWEAAKAGALVELTTPASTNDVPGGTEAPRGGVR